MGYERNDRRYGSGGRGYESYGSDDRSRLYGAQGRGDYGRGDYGRDETYGRREWRTDDRGDRARSYGGDPRGYDYQDRGFFERAGDEVRSWFGDEDAERRRRRDEQFDRRYGERGDERGYDRGGDYSSYGAQSGVGLGDYGYYGYGNDASGNRGRQGERRWDMGDSSGNRGREHDTSYRSWRDRQMSAFDNDYDEYRREHQSRFDNEFHSWRQNRQSQRDLLNQVKEHQEVVGSDGQHVGTVDHVRGDRIQLTKSDQAAGGRHHTIPSSWLQSVDDKVTLSKTAEQAKQHWRDDERDQGGLFGGGNSDNDRQTNLNRSFSGTY